MKYERHLKRANYPMDAVVGCFYIEADRNPVEFSRNCNRFV